MQWHCLSFETAYSDTPFKPTVEDKNVLNAMVFKGEQGDKIRR